MNNHNILKNQRTSLFEEHIKLKAKMLPFAGFEMPILYNSIVSEVNAIRTNIGVFDVSHMGEFFIEGPDTNKFIDYMITNSYLSSPINKAVYSPFCREDGTVIDDLIAYKLSETRSMICVNASNIQKDWNVFLQYAKNFKIQLTNESEQYSLLAVQGPKAVKTLQNLTLLSDIQFENIPYYGVKEYTINNKKWVIARTGYTGEDGFELFSDHANILQLWQNLMTKKVTPCGLGARDVLRVEVGYPLYGHELNDNITPFDANLSWAIKLNKDSIAKEALEKTKQNKSVFRLVKLSIDKGIPREGYIVLNNKDQEIGVVTSGTMSPTISKGIAICRVERSKWPQDKTFKIKIRKNIINANYISKQFVQGGHK